MKMRETQTVRTAGIWYPSHPSHFFPPEHSHTPFDRVYIFGWVISGFGRSVNEIITLLGCYAAQTGSYRRFGTTYRSNLQGSSSQRRTVSWCRSVEQSKPMGCQLVPLGFESDIRHKQPAFKHVSWPNCIYKMLVALGEVSVEAVKTYLWIEGHSWADRATDISSLKARLHPSQAVDFSVLLLADRWWFIRARYFTSSQFTERDMTFDPLKTRPQRCTEIWYNNNPVTRRRIKGDPNWTAAKI